MLVGGPQRAPLIKAAGGAAGGASISRAWAGVIPGDRAGGGGTDVTELGSGCNGAENPRAEQGSAYLPAAGRPRRDGQSYRLTCNLRIHKSKA